jgi:hypothetical protein
VLDEAHVARLARVALLALTRSLIVARAVVEAVERAWLGLAALSGPAGGAHALLFHALAAVQAEWVAQLVLARRAMPSLAAHALVTVVRVPAADASAVAGTVLGALVEVDVAGLSRKALVTLAHTVSAAPAMPTADIGADRDGAVVTSVSVLALAVPCPEQRATIKTCEIEFSRAGAVPGA